MALDNVDDSDFSGFKGDLFTIELKDFIMLKMSCIEGRFCGLPSKPRSIRSANIFGQLEISLGRNGSGVLIINIFCFFRI